MMLRGAYNTSDTEQVARPWRNGMTVTAHHRAVHLTVILAAGEWSAWVDDRGLAPSGESNMVQWRTGKADRPRSGSVEDASAAAFFAAWWGGLRAEFAAYAKQVATAGGINALVAELDEDRPDYVHHVAGVELHTGRALEDGWYRVSWADDWDDLFLLAEQGHSRLRLHHGGPNTMGYCGVDVLV